MLIKFFFTALFITFPALGWCQKIAFISPGQSNEIYWETASKFMQMAASSLGMEFETLYSERDHLESIQIARQLVSRPIKTRPDYVIFSNDYGLAPALLKIFNESKIPCLMAFSAPTSEEKIHVGIPRQKYKFWLGSIEPRAQDAGYLTARELIQKGRMMDLYGPDNKMHVIAISGDRSTNSSRLRNQGMYRAINESGDTVLDQEVYADWSSSKAEEKATWLYQRHGQAKLLWTGSDVMALGAMRALEKSGGIPGKTVLFSAINTSKEALIALQSGRLSSLAGGHFITGAWAIIMIHDYSHGIDFADEELEFVRPMFRTFNQKTAQSFKSQFIDSSKFIDFKKYSKLHNPKLKKYVFSLDDIIKQ